MRMRILLPGTSVDDHGETRRGVLRHALISYLFGAVIIGVTINVIAGFLR